MQPRSRIAASLPALALLCTLFFALRPAHSASLQTFAVVFGQLTNDIAIIESSFDNSPGQKQTLAALVRARAAILNPGLRDEQALAVLVDLLGANSDYGSTLDESARNARAAVISQYEATAARVGDLPPSRRTTVARNRFNALGADAATLANAESAAGISALLAPFGRRLGSMEKVVARAQVMPKPRVGLNAVRATVNGRRFASAGVGRPTPNEFAVSAGPFYLEVSCRVVDGGQVISFLLPVVTEDVSYEVGQGLAALSYTENIFAQSPVVHTAANGTFFVQRDRNEIYGVFSVAAEGLEVKDGRFRIQLPRELRGR